MECKVYIACSMTGRNKEEMVNRAVYVRETFAKAGLTAISPVIEEKVEPSNTKPVNRDIDKLKGFWDRDKEIIRYEAHVILLDHAEMKSFGMEREYCLSRGVLWKPTVILVPEGTPLSVAQFEDDAVFYSVQAAAEYIREKWGTRKKRVMWRLKMLNRSVPKWLYDQLCQWR